jgi:hypothetical protein
MMADVGEDHGPQAKTIPLTSCSARLQATARPGPAWWSGTGGHNVKRLWAAA